MTHAQRVALATRQFVRTPNGFLTRHPIYGCVSFPDASYKTFAAYTGQYPDVITRVCNANGKPINFRSVDAAIAYLVD